MSFNRHFFNAIIVVWLFSILDPVLVFPAGAADISKVLSNRGIASLDDIDIGNTPPMPQIGANGTFIDNSIEEDSYIIGMGDVFEIVVIEMPSTVYIARVNQNCDVYIGQFGLLMLGKITLREAKEKIAKFVNAKSNNSYTVYVTLKEGKKVSVSVNGSILNPGTMILEGIMRIWDCILKANNGKVPSFSTFDLRNVTVERGDTILKLDIMKYLLKGDTKQNPYIYPGDHIFVPNAYGRVFVQGEIMYPHPGFLSLKPDESLAEFLELISLNGAADSNYIIIHQEKNDSSCKEKIVSFSEAESIILKDMDVITFCPKKNYPEIVSVTISGAVARPGVYPCSKKNTTADYLLGLAGGLRNLADSANISIIRYKKSVNFQTETDSDKKATLHNQIINTNGSVRPEVNLSFSRLSSFMDYAIIPFSPQNSVILEDGDDIFVPYKDSYIYVSGCVEKPGAYPYAENKSYGYYVSLAGGFSSKSDKSNTYVLTNIRNVLQVRKGKMVYRGDIIVVPDSQNNKLVTTVIIPLLQIISTVVTVIIAIESLRD